MKSSLIHLLEINVHGYRVSFLPTNLHPPEFVTKIIMLDMKSVIKQTKNII